MQSVDESVAQLDSNREGKCKDKEVDLFVFDKWSNSGKGGNNTEIGFDWFDILLDGSNWDYKDDKQILETLLLNDPSVEIGTQSHHIEADQHDVHVAWQTIHLTSFSPI